MTPSKNSLASEAPDKTSKPRTRKKKSSKRAKAAKTPQTHLLNSVAESPLFNLPPELRTMIYRFALVTDEEVAITEADGIPEPALLSTSKIIRSETYNVFYFENDFCCDVQQFNPATLLMADRKVTLHDLSVGIAKPGISLKQGHDQRNWGNLVMWLRECLEGRCQSMGLAVDGVHEDVEIKLIGGLFRVLINDTEMDLWRLDVLLKHMRPTLVALHSEWGED